MKNFKELRRQLDNLKTTSPKRDEDKQLLRTSFGNNRKKLPEKVVESYIPEEPIASDDPHDLLQKNSIEHGERIHQLNSVPRSSAIRDYTTFSGDLNEELWHTHHEPSSELEHSYRKQANHLDEALSKNKTKFPFHVYTGIDYNPARHFKNDVDVRTIHHPAYISGSTNYSIAKSFSDPVDSHVLKIHVPVGTHGASVMDQSANKGEHEFVIGRGHDIEIHPKPFMIGNTHIWHAKVVRHNPKDL